MNKVVFFTKFVFPQVLINLIKSIPLNYYQDVVLETRSKNPRLLSLNVRSAEQDYQGIYLIYLQTQIFFVNL